MSLFELFIIKDGGIVRFCRKCARPRQFHLIPGTISRIKVGIIRVAFCCNHCNEVSWISLPLADYTRLVHNRTGAYIVEEGILKPMKMFGGG